MWLFIVESHNGCTGFLTLLKRDAMFGQVLQSPMDSVLTPTAGHVTQLGLAFCFSCFEIRTEGQLTTIVRPALRTDYSSYVGLY
jgi:hypothetical protein